MHLSYLLSSAFLPIFIISSRALTPSHTLIDLKSQPSSPTNLSAAALKGGSSLLEWSTKNASNNLEIACNGAQFGRGLQYASCRDAIATFHVDFTGYVTVGPRGDSQRYNFNLPLRWISGLSLTYRPLRSPSDQIVRRWDLRF